MSAHPGYEALAPGDIRIVQVQPGRRGSPIRCHLTTLNVQTSPNAGYVALSYVWGPKTNQQTIFLNGRSFSVTRNLHSALQHIRERKRGVSLWIDAICINQNDNEERGHQIAHMRSIYYRARRVMIWLGEADDTSDAAIDYILYEEHEDDILPLYVMDLFSRPWWSRVWVVQEAATARCEPILRCGDREFPWSCLRRLQTKVPFTGWLQYVIEVRMWGYKPHDTDDPIEKIHSTIHMRMFFGAVDRLRDGIVLSWRDVLALGFVMQSTDPRDLIYALIGLLDPQKPLRLEPDYAKDVAFVRREAAFLSLQCSEGLESLTMTSSISREHLPTWVADLTDGEPGIFMTADTSIYQAAQGTTARLRCSADYRILHASGIVCDTIVDVVYGRNNKNTIDKRAFSRARHVAYTSGKRNGLDTSVTKDRFWRTMIMNRGRPGFGSTPDDLVYPAPKDLGHRYMAWQKEVEVPAEAIGEGIVAEWHLEYFKPYFASLHAVSNSERWSFFTTENGRFGFGQQGAMSGDLICLLCGGRVAYILRKEKDYHILVGCAYVHGVMDGEIAMELSNTEQLRDFEIH